MSTAKLPLQVALVTTHPQGPVVAAALAKQVMRDFAPHWGVSATVQHFADATHVPAGYCPIYVKADIGEPGALGVHLDSHHQPYALVEDTPDWSVTASHELLELLADPWGNRLWVASLHGERVHILVEVCDPCEALTYGIDGVTVSDFALPGFFHTVRREGAVHDFLGRLTAPRTLLPGGYMSYVRPGGTWWQDTWFGGPAPQSRQLGRQEDLPPASSLREAIDAYTRDHR